MEQWWVIFFWVRDNRVKNQNVSLDQVKLVELSFIRNQLTTQKKNIILKTTKIKH